MKHVIKILVLIILSSGVIQAKEITFKGTIRLKNDSVIEARIVIPFSSFMQINANSNVPSATIYSNKALITIHGKKKIIDYHKLQKKVTFYNDDNTKIKLKAKDIKEVYVSLSNGINHLVYVELKTPPPFAFKKRLLLPVVVDNSRMKHYLYFKDIEAGSIATTRNIFFYNVIQIDSNKPFVPDWFNNFKSMSKYVEDCESLVIKINDGTLKLKDLNEIVEEYNKCVN